MPLPHLPVASPQDPNFWRRHRETTNRILNHDFDDSRVRTRAEIAAGVTPVNQAYAGDGGVLVDARRYDVVGDGVADDTAALTRFLDALGSGNFETTIIGRARGFLPAGVYRYTGTLNIPAYVSIVGVPYKTVLKPESLSGADAVTMDSASSLENIVILGTTSGGGKTGLHIGQSSFVNSGICRNVIVAGFIGTGAAGLHVENVTDWLFCRCVTVDCETGLYCFDSGAGTPTFIDFHHCEFLSNNGKGAWLRTGRVLNFWHCWFENNDDEGFHATSESAITDCSNVLLHGCWFEENWLSETSGANRHAKYHLYAQADRVKVRDCYFATNSTSARAIWMESATNFVIDHPDLRNEAAQVLVSNSNVEGCIANWPTSNGDVFTTVSGIANCRVNDTAQGTWTPVLTFGTPGDLSVTYAVQSARWRRTGRKVELDFNIQTSSFTHSTASGTLRITGLPFTAANNTNGASYGGLYFRGITKANFTNFVPLVLATRSYISIGASGSAQTPAEVSAADVPTAGTVFMLGTVSYEI